MEKTIKINLKDETCDIEIRGLCLNRIENLATLAEAVKESLASTLVLMGVDSDMAKKGVSLLLQGTTDIEGILKAGFRARQNRNIGKDY